MIHVLRHQYFSKFVNTGGLLVVIKVLGVSPLNDDNKILNETDTETCFPIPNFPKPKLTLFFWDQIFGNWNFFWDQILWNQNRDFFFKTKFSETDTETLQKLAKISWPRPKPRHFNTFDNFWTDHLQIFSSFSFFVFLLLNIKRYSPYPNISLLFLLRFSSPPDRTSTST